MDSVNRPHRMSRRIAELSQSGFFLTDHGNLNGFAEIQRAAKKAGVVCVPGCEFYVAARGHEDKTARDTAHLTVWAYNLEGYRNLCRLQSISYRDGFFYDPRVDLLLLAEHSNGLMAASGCLGGMACKPLVKGDIDESERRVRELSQIFENRFWIEMQNHSIPEELECHSYLLKFAKKYSLPIVATADSHYTEKGDWIPHDALICLRTNSKVGDSSRKMAYVPEEFALKSADEMLERHEASHVWESGRIFDMCEPIDITTKTFHIPVLFDSPEKEIRKRVKAGLKERYRIADPKEDSSAPTERARYELDVIIKAGFAPYLLMISDMYDFARKRKIPMGVGRGSSVGSIVCYCLGITNLDPLKYDLMFERFIDPGRVSQPDVDCDFSADRRDEIIEHFREKYGNEAVAQIVTWQTLGGRLAPRDVARVLGKPLELSDKLAKLVPQEGSVTRDREERHYVADALAMVKEFKAEYETNPDAKEIIDLAIPLEGNLKATSLHAAGVVIADKDLAEYCPLITIAGEKDKRYPATGYSMDDLEAIGLLKIDVLGLKTLDYLHNAIEMAIADGVLPAGFTSGDIDVDDPRIYHLLSEGCTKGVFQVESGGLTKLLREMEPESFNDIALAIAIFRPGPISQIPSLIARKQVREKVSYPHKLLEPILKQTYGLTIYQEQIIRIAQLIAGYSVTRADQLRKTIGKKILEKMGAEKADFIKGAIGQGHKSSWAEGLFEQVIEPAARYAFSRSHAYAYADLTAKTAFVKAVAPVQFFTALLKNTEEDSKREEKLPAYIADAREMGIAILPPDINESDFSFTPLPKSKSVRFGLNGIKFVGSKAVQEIIKKRKDSSFNDFFSTVERLKSQYCTSRVLEALVKSGAMDSIPGSRASKLASLPAAMERADMLREDAKRLAAGGKVTKRRKPIPEPIMDEAIQDKVEMLAGERELIGYYLSSHPYLDFASSVSATHTVQSAREVADEKEPISVGGIVSRLTLHTTKKGKKQMAFGAIEDDKAVLEFVIFPRQFEKLAGVVKLDAPLVLSGNVEASTADDDSPMAAKLLVSDATPIARCLKKATKDMSGYQEVITLPREGYFDLLQKVRKRLNQTDGITDLKFILADGSEIKVIT